MELKARPNEDKTYVFDATPEELALLQKGFPYSQMKPIKRTSGEMVQALVILDSPITVRTYLERRQPLHLDWHESEALQKFCDTHLTGYGNEYVQSLIWQLRKAEKDERVHASQAAKELAAKLDSGELVADVASWINQQGKSMRG